MVYKGEVDKSNKMCGQGILKKDDQVVYSGTFLNDQKHGVGK